MSIMFLIFFKVGYPLYYHVYPGTFAALMWSIEVPEPGYSSCAVIDPWCRLCDLFLLFLASGLAFRCFA
jgi:hypothetical protein